MRKMDNFYSILECTQTATQEEIKKNYQRLAKEYHPDKGAVTTQNFLLIDKAYRTLKDEQQRKDYDALLFANTCNEQSLIYAEVERKDIHFNSEGCAYYPCRCGNQFIIQPEHLSETECIIECCECSNSILIRKASEARSFYSSDKVLKNAISAECNGISVYQLANVRREFYDRLGYCLAVNGGIFEHLLKS